MESTRAAEPLAENAPLSDSVPATDAGLPPTDNSGEGSVTEKPPGSLAARASAKKIPTKKQLAKERKKKLLEHAFKDYYQFRESLSRLPPHRILPRSRA